MTTLFTDDGDPKIFNSVLESLKKEKIKKLKIEIRDLLKKINNDIEKEDEAKIVMKDILENLRYKGKIL